MASSDAASRTPVLGRSDSAGDLWQRHGKLVLALALTLAVLVAGWYVWTSTRDRQRVRAEAAYFEAQQTMASGNTTAGRTGLQNVATRYADTPAGVQSTIFLAQLDFDEKKYAEGIRKLEQAAGRGAAKAYRSSIYGLVGSAYEEQGKWNEAATNFRRAAEEAQIETDRLTMRANEARIYTKSGRLEDARRLWSEMAEDPSGPMAGEARVRLGELQAAPAPTTGTTPAARP